MRLDDDRGRKFAYFLLGIAAPIAGYLIWSKCASCNPRKGHDERSQEIAVEDSFPASDPPASW